MLNQAVNKPAIDAFHRKREGYAPLQPTTRSGPDPRTRLELEMVPGVSLPNVSLPEAERHDRFGCLTAAPKMTNEQFNAAVRQPLVVTASNPSGRTD